MSTTSIAWRIDLSNRSIEKQSRFFRLLRRSQLLQLERQLLADSQLFELAGSDDQSDLFEQSADLCRQVRHQKAQELSRSV